MNFIPGLQNNVQVLWQPVAVQQNQNQTIQALRAENQMLKLQLEAALQGQKFFPMNQNCAHNTSATDRVSFCSPQKMAATKPNQPRPCYSPRAYPHHQRIFSNYSPRGYTRNTPSRDYSPQGCQQSVIVQDSEQKRMKFEKSGEGKFFRKNNYQNQQSQSTWKTQPTKHTQSQFLKPMNNDSALRKMSFKSPLKGSYLPNMEQTMSSTKNNSMGRFKSPAFLKNRKRNSSPLKRVAILEEVRLSQSHWEDVQIKNTPPTIDESSQEQTKRAQNCVNHHRKSIKLPTMELQVECDSTISIEKALHRLRREKKRGNDEKCDTFIFEMEQKLQDLYGKENA